MEENWKKRSLPHVDPAANEAVRETPGDAFEGVAEVHLAADNTALAIEYFEKALGSLDSLHLYPQRASNILHRLAFCYRKKGDYSRALSYLRRGRSLLRSDRGPDLGKLFALQGSVYSEMGQYSRSLRALNLAYALLKGTSENEEIGNVELYLGNIHTRMGQLPKAREYYENALSTFRRIDDNEGIARALNNLGVVHKNLGELRQAVGFLEKAMRLSERTGDYSKVASHSLNLGIVHLKLGSWDLAREYLDRSVRIFTDIGGKAGVVKAQVAASLILIRERQFDRALSVLGETLAKSIENGYRREEVLSLEFAGEVELERKNLAEAEAKLECALELANEIAPKGDLVGEVGRRLAEVKLAKGELDEAFSCADYSLSATRESANYGEEGTCLRVMGLALGRKGAWDGCEELLGKAAVLLEGHGDRFELAKTFLLSGRLYLDSLTGDNADAGNGERARTYLEKALSMLKGLGLRGWIGETLVSLARLDLIRGLNDEALTELEHAERLLTSGEDELKKEVGLVRKAIESNYVKHIDTEKDELRLVEEMNRLFGGGGSPESLVSGILATAVGKTAADRGFLAGRSDGKGWVVLATKGMSVAESERVLSLISIPSEGDGKPKPRISTRAFEDNRFLNGDHKLSSTLSFIAFPIGLLSGPNGIIYVDRSRNSGRGIFGKSEIDILTCISTIAVVALVEQEKASLLRENQALKEKLYPSAHFDRVVTQDAEMLKVLNMMEKVSASSATILLEGETGTGKGLIAQVVHEASPRREKKFVQINCAALPEPLLESELFGHVHGAFTGATRTKVGLLEEADQGTVFLDEIEKITPAVQSKLLHFLDKQEMRPVGGVKWKKVDVRVICATNTDLPDKIRAGGFLEDLFYRLNDISVRVPPLRERKEDIPLLANHFLKLHAVQLGKKVGGISRELMARMVDHEWRGNVRELEKTVKRMIVLAEEGEELTSRLLPHDVGEKHEEPTPNGNGSELKTEVEKTERRVILDALRKSNWNKSKAARTLEISYPTLLSKIKVLGIDRRKKQRR
ncbi:MAG: sigma 54-interacting transcriptional regulator [Candidatus Eisenbacteria bacterium]|nr:sigma 54-interacting transcriptional regulator [Candidatus Eisenbacteria bacterium]